VNSVPTPARLATVTSRRNDGPLRRVSAVAQRSLRNSAWETGLATLLVIELVAFSIASSDFLGGGTGLLALTEQFAAIGLVALGLTPVILSGGIDLSVGSTASVCGVVMAAIWKAGVSIWVAAALALLVAALIGLVNGGLVVYARIEPLIGTLATGFILASVATAIAGNSPPYGFPSAFLQIGVGTVGAVPIQLILLGVVAAGMTLLLNRSRFGRSIAMIGHNHDAARYSGLAVGRQCLRAYMLCALLAGLAGLVLGAFYSAVRRDLGDSLLLPGITMVVLGGVDIFGGRGKVGGVILAVFTLGFLTQGLLIVGYSELVTTMIVSVVLLISIAAKVSLAGGEGTLVSSLRRRFSGRTPGSTPMNNP